MSDQPMTLPQALDIAEQAAPMPSLARGALATLRTHLEAATSLLNQIRDHAGVTCAVEDLPEAVAAMRRAGVAIPATLEVRACFCGTEIAVIDAPKFKYCPYCSGSIGAETHHV